MKNIVIIGFVLALFFVTGWFFGRRSTPVCSEPVPITGTVPADSVAAGMTEVKPDTVFVPKIVPVPGPERIVYLPDTLHGAPKVVPIDSVPAGPDRDAAVDAAVTDWNTKRHYAGTLFNDPRAGSVMYDFTVRFNRIGAINYRFVPVPATVSKIPRFGVGVQAGYGITSDGLRPYVGVGIQYNLFSF